MNPGGGWTPVSAANFTLPTARVICAELGCGKAVSVREDLSFRVEAGQVWAEQFRCEGQEPELWLCPRVPCAGGSCSHTGTVQVVCSELTEVRLRSSVPSSCAGQVEMRKSENWRMLCASHWSAANSQVVCRQVGCGVALPTPKGAHSAGGGGGEIWPDRFHCSGAESFLWNCPVSALGVPACSPGNAAMVVCSGESTQRAGLRVLESHASESRKQGELTSKLCSATTFSLISKHSGQGKESSKKSIEKTLQMSSILFLHCSITICHLSVFY
ncbi:Antigen WC1.1 [Fukomys damarensis]|uniref:Antigen WC1.1 n=1 Tax=Fukomys damarensis TaxID=885580 RepID=A0A091E1H9_FUKDA|nr:Antigen WC1.1 [Fukomys damarensis]